jgi:hypothetical protein
MKKVILITAALLLAAAYTVNAQLVKGRYFAAGSNRLELNIGGEKSKYDGTVDESSKYSYFDFDLQPKFGYTVINNLVVGGFLDIDLYSWTAKDDSYFERGATFILGPFARFYFLDFDKLRPFAEAAVGFGIDNYKIKFDPDDDYSKYNETVFRYRLGGGATYFFNEFVGADLFLGFAHDSYMYNEDESDGSRSGKETVVYAEFLMQLGVVVMLDK